MSMHGLPSVPCCTGSSTVLPAADRVTWSREGFWDTALAPRCVRAGASSPARMGVIGKRPLSHSGKTRTAALGRPSGGDQTWIKWRLLGVALLELVDAAAGVHHLVLAGVERVRGRGDVDLGQRVLVAVLPLDRLLGGDRRAGQELEVGSHVLEHDYAVIGMDRGLHGGTGLAAG